MDVVSILDDAKVFSVRLASPPKSTEFDNTAECTPYASSKGQKYYIYISAYGVCSRASPADRVLLVTLKRLGMTDFELRRQSDFHFR